MITTHYVHSYGAVTCGQDRVWHQIKTPTRCTYRCAAQWANQPAHPQMARQSLESTETIGVPLWTRGSVGCMSHRRPRRSTGPASRLGELWATSSRPPLSTTSPTPHAHQVRCLRRECVPGSRNGQGGASNHGSGLGHAEDRIVDDTHLRVSGRLVRVVLA